MVSYLELDSSNGYERIEVIGWQQDDEVRSSKILVMYNLYNTVIDYLLIIFMHFIVRHINLIVLSSATTKGVSENEQ